MQPKEAIRYFQNKLLNEYDDEADLEISDFKQFFDFIKEDVVHEYGEEGDTTPETSKQT